MLISDRAGVVDRGRTGLFAHDTRYLSVYRISINGFAPNLLSSVRTSYYTVTHNFSNPPLGAYAHVVPFQSLYFRVDRAIGDGLHEDFALSNFSGAAISLQLIVTLDADFADIMQVRGFGPMVPRIAEMRWIADARTLVFHYQNGLFERNMAYRVTSSDSPPRNLGHTIFFDIALDAGATWRARIDTTLDTPILDGADASDQTAKQRATTPVHSAVQTWATTRTRIRLPSWSLQRTYDQAVIDFASLRFERVDDGWFPAAGVPWYVAVFGRDSLWASLQVEIVACGFGRSTLIRLAELQGHEVEPRRDEELGKIPHEVRFGELTYLGKLPYSPYYGTSDASLLYVILLARYYAYTGDIPFVRHYLPIAKQCLDWAAEWGDSDGDGFIEYFPHCPQGYHNQSWKDAGDAIVYPDGRIVPDPIATCELQGYYYAALRAMATLQRVVGQPEAAQRYDRHAADLYAHFNDVFWMPDASYYALGLDPDKQPIRTIASNPGQLLWCRIVPPERAGALIRRLFAPDMFSGWGIRTLSSDTPAYNPIAYQRGSVWPHDNGIIALGMKRYGYWREANHIARGIFDAATMFERHSLPELFAGLPREPDEPPVPYIEANVPQAWAAGSVFHLLQAIVGLEVDPVNGTLRVQPTLPDWLPHLEIRNLEIGTTVFDLRFTGIGPETRTEVLRQSGPRQIVIRSVGE